MLDKMNAAETAEHDAIRLEQDVAAFVRRHGNLFSYQTLPLQATVETLESAYDKLGKMLIAIRRSAA